MSCLFKVSSGIKLSFNLIQNQFCLRDHILCLFISSMSRKNMQFDGGSNFFNRSFRSKCKLPIYNKVSSNRVNFGGRIRAVYMRRRVWGTLWCLLPVYQGGHFLTLQISLHLIHVFLDCIYMCVFRIK